MATTTNTQETVTYQVIDRQTKAIMGTYKKRASASRRADKLDLIYGAIRYSVKPSFVK